MLYSRLMVMSFPFVTTVERNERQKKKDVISANNKVPCAVSKENAVKSHEGKITSSVNEKNVQDMICLSNLEEIVFFTSSSRCLLDEIKTKPPKSKVNYDKYLEFFE